MDEILEATLKVYLEAFDSFPCDNAKINAEVEQFKEELTRIAESSKDVIAFMADYEAKGYSKRYLDLFGKIAQAQTSDLTVEEIEDRQQITPVEFVSQYNVAYESVRDSKYRVKAEQAYRNLFEVAERSEDMMDFNIECERGNLLFKLSADDAIEQSEFVMEASDPLDKIAYLQHLHMVERWQQAVSDADITYSSEIEQEETARRANRETQRLVVITAVATLATEYVLFKTKLLAATNDRTIRETLSCMMHKRGEMKQLVTELLPAFDLSLETIFEDKYYRHLLLSPTNLDSTGRIMRCYHPQNIEALKEVITEEMLTDKSITELVFRHAKTPLYFAIKRQDKEVARKYKKIAKEMNANLTYYKENIRIPAKLLIK